MNSIKKTFQYGSHSVTLETGGIARQASGAIKISMGDTVILVTAVVVKEPRTDCDFFPLTVNYQERFYSAGRIPGGFHKREGRPTTQETLTSRLIDRPIRPLFPKGFFNVVQIIANVMSLDPEIPGDVPAIIGAAAALAISGVPFNGPLAAARVGYVNGQYQLNPAQSELPQSQLDLVVAGTKNAVLMVESDAKELSEEVMLGAVMFGHEQMQVAIQAIEELVKEVGVPAWEWAPSAIDVDLEKRISDLVGADLQAAYQIHEKAERMARVKELREKVVESLCGDDESAPTDKVVKDLFSDLEHRLVREQILSQKPRIDGRDTKTVRPINIEVGVLPRTHGSALFTRGETQAMVVTTLGTGRDAQIIDAPVGESKDAFMLHYNFPPYCVGEAGFLGSPKRREIGHGNLARRALLAMLPTAEDFPYVLRVVSEITESNGSSSMATVCGTSLSLMDAGVPIKAPVAGIAMGLIKEGNDFAVLTDILGDEDHLGDMDFKVAGTRAGVTALQMDIKIDGITREIMEQALAQAKDGRLHILGLMEEAISKPREEMSVYAPRLITIKIDTDKIRDVIGKGGSTIRQLVEETGAAIDVNDEGIVTIATADAAAGEEARRRIELLTASPEVGKIYEGKVVKLMDFGAFVNILPGKDGLVHVSQIANERVEHVEDYLKEGDIVRVKLLEIDRQGKLRLSIKALDQE